MVTRQQRLAVFAAIAVAILLVLWFVMRGGGYYVNAQFETGGQVVKGADVMVGGSPVGKIDSISLTSNNLAKIRLRIDREDLTPLHRGTTATIRLTSLSGVANRYISLDPGPNNAPEIADEGIIEVDETNPPVDLDQLLNAFTPEVTKGLQKFLQGSADQYADDPSTPLNETAYGNASLRWVAPFFDAGARLAASVSQDSEVLSQFLVVSEQATTTLAAQKEQLAALFANLRKFTTAVSQESEELDRALAVLPSTLREGSSAFKRLRPAMAALRELSDESAPIGEDLAPMFRRLRPLLDNAEPTIRDLRYMMRKSGSANDVTDLLAQQPKLTKLARSAFPNSTVAMQLAAPILDFLRPYTPELTAWISHFGQVAANYDANGHYIRVQTTTGRFQQNGATLDPLPQAQGLAEYPKTGIKRCPGTGTQAPADASSPFLDNGLDCDPSIVPPGP
ncbi:MAG: MlaD family protein [Solirubrobacterales bacterium]